MKLVDEAGLQSVLAMPSYNGMADFLAAFQAWVAEFRAYADKSIEAFQLIGGTATPEQMQQVFLPHVMAIFARQPDTDSYGAVNEEL